MRAILWAVLALAAGVGPALVGSDPDGLGAALFGFDPSELVFEETHVDFGTVFTGETVQHDFAFRNRSGAPIRIEEAAGTCGCVEAKPSKLWIEPGARGNVRVQAVLDGRYGPQDLRVRVRTDEGATVLALRGRVRAVVRPHPWRLLLGEVEPGVAVVETVRLERLEPVEDLEVAELRGGGLEGRVDGDTLHLELDPPAVLGTRFGGALLAFRHAASGRRLELWIPVVWTVPPPLSVEPAEALLVDGRAELTVRPRWRGVVLAGVDVGGLPLDVTRRDVDGGVRLEIVRRGAAWEIGPGAVLRLRVTPKALGPVEVPVR